MTHPTKLKSSGTPPVAPGVRKVFKQLREKSRNTLFSHMHVEGDKESTIFLKPHGELSGYSRVMLDFTYFMLGVDNPEFAEAMRLGLFDVQPVRLRQEPLVLRESPSKQLNDGLRTQGD